jgi:uncharacterized protein YndB with AHSA1/START domain
MYQSNVNLKNRTTVDRKSECELAVTRLFNAPMHAVFEAWTKPELFMQWWAPKSTGMSMLSCEMDVRVGGGYRITFGQDASNSMAFFGIYLEVVPQSRVVWSNEESEEGVITTLTFEAQGDQTRVVLHERYSTKLALDASIEGMETCMPEQFEQLDELLIATGLGGF